MKLLDLTGKRFGRLTVIQRGEDYVSPNGSRAVRWECKCDCGNTTLVTRGSLTNGFSQSCGCYRQECITSPRNYFVDGNIAHLDIGGKEVLIDAEDLSLVMFDWWHISKNGYAVSNRDKKTMHSVLVHAPEGYVIDHINRNKLDNRRHNLRVATYSTNGYNATRKIGNTGEKYIHRTKRGYYVVSIDGKYRGCTRKFDEAINLRNECFETSEAKASGATI